MGNAGGATHRDPWNKGKIVRQKAPFKPKDIWALCVRLQMESRVRELAFFNLGINSKLRGCDLVALRFGTFAMETRLRHAPSSRRTKNLAPGAVRDNAGDPGRPAGVD